MIFVGWGVGAKQIGEGFFEQCGNCHNTCRFVVVESSRRVSLYFVTVAKWAKRYYYACPICSQGIEIENLRVAQRLLAAAFSDPLAMPETYFPRIACLISRLVGRVARDRERAVGRQRGSPSELRRRCANCQ